MTPCGIVMDNNDEHPLNAAFAIEVTLLGIVMDNNDEQSRNAESPIEVTLFPKNVTEDNFVHQQNA